MRTIILTAIVAIATVSTPALASSPEAAAAHISYADLDLTRAGDVVRLQHRVAAAMEKVCGSYAGADPVETDAIGHCRALASEQAKSTVAALIAKDRAVDYAAR